MFADLSARWGFSLAGDNFRVQALCTGVRASVLGIQARMGVSL
jgi:hypothetical protein